MSDFKSKSRFNKELNNELDRLWETIKDIYNSRAYSDLVSQLKEDIEKKFEIEIVHNKPSGKSKYRVETGNSKDNELVLFSKCFDQLLFIFPEVKFSFNNSFIMNGNGSWIAIGVD